MSRLVDFTRALVLVRLRQGVCGEVGRAVHLVPLPRDTEVSGVRGALCGVSLVAEQVETVAPGVGMPCMRCMRCLLHRDSAVQQPATSATMYREWGWPVTVRENQVLLTLGVEVTALVLPDGLSAVRTVLRAAVHTSGVGS